METRYLKVLSCIVLVLAVSTFGVAGCKFSPAITELVPNMNATESVEGTPPVAEPRKDAEQDERGAAQKGTGAVVETDAKAAVAYDPDKPNKRYRSAEVVYDAKKATTDTLPSKGGKAKKAGDEGSYDEKHEGRADTGGSGAGADGVAGAGQGDGSGKGDGAGDGGGGTDPTESEKRELPAGKRIAAAGEAANIVQMLSGELRAAQIDKLGADSEDVSQANYLVACDENFRKRVAKAGVYPGEGVDKALVAWSEDDGTQGGLKLKVLEQAKVDLVVYESGTATVSAKNLDALEKAGIATLALPALRQDSDIVTAVAEAAEALAKGAKGDKNAILKKAAAWEERHDTVIDEVLGKNGGHSVAKGYDFNYVDQPSDTSKKTPLTTLVFYGLCDYWSDRWSTKYIDGKDVGVSVGNWTVYPNAYYLACAGVVDNLAVKLVASGGLDDPKIGAKRLAGDDKVGSDGGNILFYKAAAILPMSPSSTFDGTTEFGVMESGKADFTGSPTAGTFGLDMPKDALCGYDAGTYSAFNSEGKASTRSYLGADSFPAVIVESAADKKAVVASQKRATGVYHPRGHTKEQMYRGGAGWVMCVGVEDDFDVYVCPGGLLVPWTRGGAESFLLASWARSMFYGDYSASKARSRVESYYKTFYRSKAAAPDVD